ncbi:pyridoxal phosphate-dependent aminotransferase [Gordonia sp. KTR9]|uniref:pyridoxal phosphate-dependent aminotransferase n=1 Tax=Gordonia sp. KTR9 TaxID=337191 RepID=UPI00027DDE85|nr:aminotransferase class I/II-fold pyridoxal phosphate-dependent enzyme [Gordonia sp. KTR9]AFR48949.1 aminotransferase [Gordonia sp. KTR9]
MTVVLPDPTGAGLEHALTRSTDIVRCDRNESAYPPLPAVVSALRRHSADAHHYPSFRPEHLRTTVAEHIGSEEENITIGAGATAVLSAILQDSAARFRTAGCRTPRIATPAPTFEGFALLADMIGMMLDTTPLLDDGRPDMTALAAAAGSDTAAVIVCSPHNPTGSVVTDDEIRGLLATVDASTPVILDQAYIEYSSTAPDIGTLLTEHPNLIVVRTFSKAHGLAGLRVGYATGSATSIRGARRHEVPFSITAAAEQAASLALAASDELAGRVTAMRRERGRLAAALDDAGHPALPSEANFLYVPGADGIEFGRRLRSAGVVGREFDGHGHRLTVPDRAGTDLVIAAIRRAR